MRATKNAAWITGLQPSKRKPKTTTVPPGSLVFIPFHALYAAMMLGNTTSAVHSIDRVWDAHTARESESPDHRHDRMLANGILLDLQNIVVQASALSHYFWPAKKDYDDRAARLREEFSVDDYSPFKCAHLRKGLANLDEKLDEILTAGPHGHVLPEYVGPKFLSGKTYVQTLRAYYPQEGVFQLLNKTFQINPLVQEILRVHHLLARSAPQQDRPRQKATERVQ